MPTARREGHLCKRVQGALEDRVCTELCAVLVFYNQFQDSGSLTAETPAHISTAEENFIHTA